MGAEAEDVIGKVGGVPEDEFWCFRPWWKIKTVPVRAQLPKIRNMSPCRGVQAA